MKKNIFKIKISVWIVFSFTLFAFLSSSFSVNAQYFGQNKVRYKKLNFKVYETPHFSLYYYLRNENLVKRFAQEAEVWYNLHQQVFRDTFAKKNPIILYANSPDFQQTTAIQGDIGVGTGGVTEGMKNRIVMPITQLNQQTRHVMGHELVHAFQYHILMEGDSTSIENIDKVPLWMIEGMAEYLSIGKVDAYTGMWMRDAYLSKDIPTLRQLTMSNRYFPYRYGQAFWSYVGSTYGDTVIVPFFKQAAKYGYEKALVNTFGYDEKTFSSLWKTSIENTYKPYIKDTAQAIVGKRIIDNKNAGEHYNIAPAISPDGKYVAFLSEKDLLSIDLFLADAQTGKILQKLTSKARNSHIDEFNFIESAGAWSPDGKQFAFSTFSAGRNQLVTIDVSTGKTRSMKSMGEVEEFGNLAWSPDGGSIAFSGLKNGQSDLFLYDLHAKGVTQLTSDPYSDYQPSFSNDGRKIVFSSDRTTFNHSLKGVHIPFNLAVLNLKEKSIENIILFNGANNLNPQFSANDQKIYFLSNRDGFRNLYRYDLSSTNLEQLTKYFTGISGITEFSPALSISKNDDILYSYYQAQKYAIYNAKASEFAAKPVDPQDLNPDAAILPPAKSTGIDIINSNLNNFSRFERINHFLIDMVPYRPKFKLDYISSNGVGVGVSAGGYGTTTGLSSGAQGIFSDITGQNQIFTAVAVNGQIYDFGAQVAYTHQKSRIDWGVSLSHIPYVSAALSSSIDPDPNGGPNPVYNEKYDLIHTFVDQLALFSSYPFSRVNRFEVSTGLLRYSYRIDRYNNYYQYNPNTKIVGANIGAQHEKLSSEKTTQSYGTYLNPFSLYQIGGAFVGDNSFWGITAPLNGRRYRLGLEAYLGDYHLGVYTLDFRRYVRLKPITIAGRLYGYGRFGTDEKRLYPLYVGYDYYIRGYNPNSFHNSGSASDNGFNVNQLTGSRIAVANLEVRLPFTGPKKLSAIESKFFFTDLNAFFDIGIAYYGDSKIAFDSQPSVVNSTPAPTTNDPNATNVVYNRTPAISAGISLRVNLFGVLIIEPYYAIPFQRTDIGFGIFGLNLAPGW